MKPTLTIMSGIPRCGKSTWIRNNKKDAIVVSPDDIRKEMFGHQFYAPANKFVFGVAEGMASLILKQGRNVIIDATHINPSSRLTWKIIANNCNANVKIVWIYACKDMVRNLGICLERNATSPKGSQLPIDALAIMAMKFEVPSRFDEGEWFEFEEFHSTDRSHRREIPKEKRIIINKDDSILNIVNKWREKWDVAENKDKDS